MQQFELIAEPRTNVGKGASRRLRRTGKVPGILYGTDKKAVSIQLEHDDLMHHLDNEAFYSHILTLKIGKKTEEVVLRDLQRHPFKPKLLHIDLQRIKATERITMRVPVHILNGPICPGVIEEGGIVNNLLTQLEVTCLPKHLPEFIEVDIAALHIGDSLQLSDLALPEGVKLELLVSDIENDRAVVSVQHPQVEQEEEEVEEEVLDEDAIAEGETAEGETAEGETAEGETAEDKKPESE